MILIADSGSTKTDWRAVEKGRDALAVTTKGMNPFFQSGEEIATEIQTALLPAVGGMEFDEIWFYGAGCVPEKIPAVRDALGRSLKAGRIEVGSDMLGAARGLSGRMAGIVCIMGTGSNSCAFDGQEITANVSPLGFILGDEGSGASLGKILVGDLLKNQLPVGMKEKFLQQYGLTPATIVENVYRRPFPNRFLASLSPFLAQNLNVPEIRKLVYNSFKSFLTRNVQQYDYHRYATHFTGSVAYHYREILKEAAYDCDLLTGAITQSPIDGLVKYHAE